MRIPKGPCPSPRDARLVMVLLLDGLEVFDEDDETATEHFLADRAAPDHSPKARAPDGHLPAAMGWDDGASVDVCGNLGHGEVPATPLGHTRKIGGNVSKV